MAKIYLFIICIFFADTCFAQKTTDSLKRDTARHLSQVTVKGYLIEQPVLSVPASVSVLSPAQLQLQPGASLVPALNTVPGVRMEERSPGSYRLSIRGSLLRSPFGVRDVKIYYDEMPLTDAGGNTYLNAIDVNNIQGVEILKGPDGSLFGANSGGVVLISPVNRYNDSSYLSGGVSTGSYGLFHQNITLQNHTGNNQLNIGEAYQTAAGYRQNSNMYRAFFQVDDKLTVSQKDQLKFLCRVMYPTWAFLTRANHSERGTSAICTFPSAVCSCVCAHRRRLLHRPDDAALAAHHDARSLPTQFLRCAARSEPAWEKADALGESGGRSKSRSGVLKAVKDLAHGGLHLHIGVKHNRIVFGVTQSHGQDQFKGSTPCFVDILLADGTQHKKLSL